MGTHLDDRRTRTSQEGHRENARPTGSGVAVEAERIEGRKVLSWQYLSALGKVSSDLIGHEIWGASPLKTPGDSKRQEGHLFCSRLGSRSLALFARHRYQFGQLCK